MVRQSRPPCVQMMGPTLERSIYSIDMTSTVPYLIEATTLMFCM